MNRTMMRFCLVLISLFFSLSGIAQDLDKSKWTYEVKKKGGNEYDLIFHLSLPKGWHIFSINPGGDGTLIAPAFVFENNPILKTKGNVAEKGKLISETMEGYTGKINMYENKVDYTQHATISGKGKITGTLTYQICNDKMCLPPKDKSFTFIVK